jgi:hypothetical protein
VKTDSDPNESLGQQEDRTIGSEQTSKFSEDMALALLERPDVTSEALVALARNPAAIKIRKVTLALTTHPRTPRHISVPLLRHLFTFDLMQVALTPSVAPDIKRAAEEQLLNRLESLSAGERITLARRASGRIAAALLHDSDVRVITTALDNSHLVEASVVTALMKKDAAANLFEVASHHPNWSQRRDVQIALLRSEKTPLDHAEVLAKNFSASVLQEILPNSRQHLAGSGNPEV